ncbi:MAG: hypothetical protein IPL40_13435 [Proteobacteria bacterium]|nr:hypothetical protein [Pseudomonadota bacterium]
MEAVSEREDGTVGAGAGPEAGTKRSPEGPSPAARGEEAAAWRQALEAEAVAALSGLEDLALVQLSRLPASYLAVGRQRGAEDGARRSVAARQVVDFFRQRRLTVYPALYAPTSWAALDTVLPRGSWAERLSPAWGVSRQLDFQRDAAPQPRQTRQWLLALLKGHRTVIDALRGGDLPGHIVLGICAGIARDVLELLFATRGEAFADDYSSLAAFAAFTTDGHFAAEDGYSYFELRALAEQAARHQRFLPRDAEVESFETGSAVDTTERLIAGLEGYAKALYTSAEERQRQRRWRLAALAVCGAVVLVALGLAVRSVWPLAPIANQALITAPGGITGTYYRGVAFEKQAFSRVDERIDFDSTGAFDPRLEADRFSIRWRGYLRFPEGGAQQLCIKSDDGGRVRLGGALIAQDWGDHPERLACGKVRVRAGWYPLEVEYYDASSRGVVRLQTGPDLQHLATVPAAELCCR